MFKLSRVEAELEAQYVLHDSAPAAPAFYVDSQALTVATGERKPSSVSLSYNVWDYSRLLLVVPLVRMDIHSVIPRK